MHAYSLQRYNNFFTRSKPESGLWIGVAKGGGLLAFECVLEEVMEGVGAFLGM